MASPSEVTKAVPETLPADFIEWDNGSDSEEAQPLEPSRSDPQGKAQDDRSLTAARRTAVPLTEHPRAFAASAAKPSQNFPAPKNTMEYGGKIDVAQRATTSKPVADRRSTPRSAPEATAGTRSALVLDASAPAEALADESIEPHLRAIFSRNEEIVEESNGNGKRMAVIGGSVVTVLLATFLLFHSGAIAKLTGSGAKQPIANKVNMQLDRNATTANPTQGLAGTNSAANQTANKPSAAVPEQTDDADAQPNKKQTTPAPEQAQMMHDQLLAPTRIPEGARGAQSGDAPPPSALTGMEALNGNAAPGALFKGQAQPNVQSAAPKFVNISADVAVGMLTQRTVPAYPPIAKQARIGGTVTLQATITKSGTVTNLRVLNGPTVLRQAALDAVKSWHYRPYLYGNQPTEANTTINVVFNPGN
jgi:protein TonB